MGLTELIFGPKTHLTVGVVQFDASISETHARECQVTDHPVEEGATISDHIRRTPEKLDVNGIVTNHPLIFLASVQAVSPLTDDLSPVTDRAELAYSKLRELMDNGELVTVVTSLWEYSNMAITSMSVTRDVQNGNVLNCSLSLREVIIAKTETVAAPVPVKTAQKKAKDKGKKVSSDASSAQQAKSSSILGKAFIGG
jgi:hypothetical protein